MARILKMKDIALIGGMGSGKTTLAEALMNENPEINYVYGSKYIVRIPMTLIGRDHPNLLSYPKEKLIDTVLENEHIEWDNFSRQEMDEFCQKVADIYGGTFNAEMFLRAGSSERQNVFDNIAKASNVRYLKDKGVYVVGLDCSFETQVERRLKDRKDIDPAERILMKRQVSQTNAYFEIEEIMKLADAVYGTDNVGVKDYPALAKKIVQSTQ